MVYYCFMLWFDVESRYKATVTRYKLLQILLWFDVESRYKATIAKPLQGGEGLWFDVESRYKATPVSWCTIALCCGLM